MEKYFKDFRMQGQLQEKPGVSCHLRQRRKRGATEAEGEWWRKSGLQSPVWTDLARCAGPVWLHGQQRASSSSCYIIYQLTDPLNLRSYVSSYVSALNCISKNYKKQYRKWQYKKEPVLVILSMHARYLTDIKLYSITQPYHPWLRLTNFFFFFFKDNNNRKAVSLRKSE